VSAIQIIFPATHWADTIKNVVTQAGDRIVCEISPYGMVIDDHAVSYISTADDTVVFEIERDELAATLTAAMVTITLSGRQLTVAAETTDQTWSLTVKPVTDQSQK
jgi:hypothetical protein